MTTYNKLVRDKIPDIIKSRGSMPIIRRIESDEEYLEALLDKDVEESLELASDTNLEELADKIEVLYAIGKAIGYTAKDIETARLKKLQERGGFEDRIFLESVEESQP